MGTVCSVLDDVPDMRKRRKQRNNTAADATETTGTATPTTTSGATKKDMKQSSSINRVVHTQQGTGHLHTAPIPPGATDSPRNSAAAHHGAAMDGTKFTSTVSVNNAGGGGGKATRITSPIQQVSNGNASANASRGGTSSSNRSGAQEHTMSLAHIFGGGSTNGTAAASEGTGADGSRKPSRGLSSQGEPNMSPSAPPMDVQNPFVISDLAPREKSHSSHGPSPRLFMPPSSHSVVSPRSRPLGGGKNVVDHRVHVTAAAVVSPRVAAMSSDTPSESIFTKEGGGDATRGRERFDSVGSSLTFGSRSYSSMRSRDSFGTRASVGSAFHFDLPRLQSLTSQDNIAPVRIPKKWKR